MTMVMWVQSEGANSFLTKTGQMRNEYRLNVCDVEPGVQRCSARFEYTLSADEKDKYAGKLQDKTVKLLCLRMSAGFGNVFRLEGRILEVVEPKK